MGDLGFLGWIIIGLLAGAIAGFFVPGRERFGCLGTMLIGVVGGFLGGFLWVNVLGQDEASGWLGALVIAVIGSIIVLLVLRAMRGGDRT
ncbi:MAG TPA: GlsB/YeaQ/YmgE family stress response membrane protein [Candidatus Limnocylindria bacterium]|nr:GlsB/YeaQ/YmgE family stress response membrane protein [Candidatus Limnocylindria bacterium]